MSFPDAFRKSSNSPPYTAQNDVSKRIAHVDLARVNKEKKLLFDKVEQEEEYYPFGSPGSGAPLSGGAKLPNLNENLWKRYVKEENANSDNSTNNLESRKKEIHELIDTFTQVKTFAPNGQANSPIISEKRAQYGVQFDPKTRSHIQPETYWNDWFGRPGAGAPNGGLNKQNLEEMLEPRKSRDLMNTIHRYEPYTPTGIQYNSTQYTPNGIKKFRSDHHNRYELTPR